MVFIAEKSSCLRPSKNLTKDVIEACVDFAMVAKLGEVKPVNKSELRQALRCKVNSIKFNSSKPGYFVGKI